MKHDRDGQESLPDPERDGIDAEEDDLTDSVADRERLFSKVEAEGGRGVHVAIHVVHEVEAPEEGNDVVDAVPDPEGVIEQHDGERDLDRPGELRQVQQSEMSLLGPLGRRDEKGGLQDRDDGQRDASGRQVASDAARFGLALSAKWPSSLEEEQNEKGDRRRGRPAPHNFASLSVHTGGAGSGWSLLPCNQTSSSPAILDGPFLAFSSSGSFCTCREESHDRTGESIQAGKVALDDRARVYPRRGWRLYRPRRASRLERRGAARQRRHRVREKRPRRRVGPQHRGPSRPDVAHPDDRRASLHRAGLLPGAHARSRAVSDRGLDRRHPPDSGPDGAVRHALRKGKHRRISKRDAGARPPHTHDRRPGHLPAHPAQALAGHTLQGSGLGSSVILRLATRQSLRRSRGRAKAAMATARGYGSPAKAESRYGDGASDLSSEAHCAKEEATKTLPPGSNNGSARGASPGGTRDSRRASEAPGMRPAPPTATERLLLTSRRPFRSWTP